jgi:hypothetical protein
MLDLPNVVDGAYSIQIAQLLPSPSLGFHYLKYTSVCGLIQHLDYGRFRVPAGRGLLLLFGIFLTGRLCSGH